MRTIARNLHVSVPEKYIDWEDVDPVETSIASIKLRVPHAGLAERQDGSWAVRFGPIELGIIDHRGQRLRKPKPAACGLVDNPDGLPTTPQPQQPQQPI